MLALVKGLFANPLLRLKRGKGRVPKATLDTPPTPPQDTDNLCEFGSYCIRATVDAYDVQGKTKRTFIGHSQELSIIKKTENTCDRYKQQGTKCGEVSVVFKGGKCDDSVFMKLENGELVHIS